MPHRASPFHQGGQTPLSLVAALASAAVCVALVLLVVKVVVGLVLRVACGATRARWWADLPADERDKMSGRLACSFHHAVAAGLCLSAVVHDNSQHFVWAFFWEAGFDISDSLLAALGVGFTGMQGLPLYLHHGVALLMEVACALFGYDWYIMAQCFAILLGSGAIDLIFSKVVPKTPWQESKLLRPLLVTHFVGFVVLRLGYLSLLGYHLLVEAWGARQPLASGLIATACAVMFSLYHLLLGTGLFSFIRRPPSPPGATEPQGLLTLRKNEREGEKKIK